MPLTEYKSGAAFHGVIGRTTAESSPVQPQPVRAVPGAPNVMFIVLDDTGYGQLGCYGSPIATLHLDALAASGLLYHNMHTTALCSPSRSCIITGRNHHTNAAAAINIATGYPGYNGNIPFENGFLSEMLLQHGYSTYLVGTYHLLPSEYESAAGPFDLGRSDGASSASTASSAAAPANGIPTLSTTTTRSIRRAPQSEAIISPPTWLTKRSSSSPTRSRSPRTSRSSCTSAPARHTPPRPVGMADRYRGQFDNG